MTSERMEDIDLLIVGCGPAGSACALQAHRDGLRIRLVGDEPVGGLIRAARRLDNLPGAPGIAGGELAERLARQLEAAGVTAREGRVVELKREDRFFHACLADGSTFRSRSVCLATGTRPRRWPVAPEAAVVRDARALAASLAGRRVVVVGGGEAALDTALSARERGAAVTILARGETLRGAAGLVAEVGRAGLDVRLGVQPCRVAGGPGRWTVELEGGGTIDADELVVCIGREPCGELWRLSAEGAPDAAVEQPRAPGVFAAGDLIRGRERYAATAMGDGQRAALAAAAWLEERR
jgi:thioredoxin reductase